MTEEKPKDDQQLLVELGAALTARAGETYDERRARLIGARDLLHQALATQFEGPFMAHLRSLPTATLAEKQALARHANEELRALGLAIASPKTGEPTFLRGDGSRNRDTGRFQLCALRQGRAKLVATSVHLFDLRLIGHPRHLSVGHDDGKWAERADLPERGRRR